MGRKSGRVSCLNEAGNSPALFGLDRPHEGAEAVKVGMVAGHDTGGLYEPETANCRRNTFCEAIITGEPVYFCACRVWVCHRLAGVGRQAQKGLESESLDSEFELVSPFRRNAWQQIRLDDLSAGRYDFW